MFIRRFLQPLTLNARNSSSRSLWTAVTGTGPTLEACLDSCVQQAKLQKGATVAIAMVSKSFEAHDYENLPSLVKERLSPTWLVGSVVDRVPSFEHGVSLWVGYDEKVVGFQVKDGPERNKVRSVSVGRWGRPEDLSRVNYQRQKMEDAGWEGFESISRPTQQYPLPDELSTSKTPSLVFLASDNEPDELLKNLDHHFPDTAKVGIISASTPFVNGNPYTLFYQDKLMGAGITGFASYSAKKVEAGDVSIEHAALQAMGKTMKITRCRGNIILDLDQAGATGLLLELIKNKQNALISKDETFYLGIYAPGEVNEDKSKMTVCRVTSGDPSRGNMSIDTTIDLQEGQVVQFMRRTKIANSDLLKPAKDDCLVLGVSDKDTTIDAFQVNIPPSGQAIVGVVGGSSENGVIIGKPGMQSQIMDVPYSKVTLCTQ
ncbi:hypothetical protein CLU79DRAFT_717131 [Phycomyces nitens]|nr:hypothetical protein CLU79DRAFT_717131 [Phycomyces nitens]